MKLSCVVWQRQNGTHKKSHVHLFSRWRWISAGGLPMSAWIHIHRGSQHGVRPRCPLLHSQTHRLNGSHRGRLQIASGRVIDTLYFYWIVGNNVWLWGCSPLQECSVLDLAFNLRHWQEAGLWEDPCLRIGWIQGLKNLLQHPKALSFFVQSGDTSCSLLFLIKDNMMKGRQVIFRNKDHNWNLFSSLCRFHWTAPTTADRHKSIRCLSCQSNARPHPALLSACLVCRM